MEHFKTGIKYGLRIKGEVEDKEAINIFSKYFYVCFSRTSIFKDKEYNYVFLKTGGKLKSQFNLANQILLLFSNDATFDNKSLDFVDKTLFEYSNRLDKICVLLISKDENITNKIEKLNRENKESKIIIPFTYKEVITLGEDENYLENKFRKYFYSRDLFALESPLKSENYFYGRIQTVQAFYDRYCLGEHGGLFGLRKIGKTSVLYGVERLIESRQGISVYIDCQDTSIHKSRWYEVLYTITKRLKEKYNLHIEIDDKEKYDEKTASELFEYNLKKIYKLLKENRILLIFDEIEHISFETSSSVHWRKELDYIYFWQTLRGVYQRNSELFCFLIAGVNPLSVEQPTVEGHDNPIFSLINPIYLSLFNIDNVEEMVGSIGSYMGLGFEREIFSNLTDDYGGHPFLIRHVCSLINKDMRGNRPKIVKKYFYKEHKEKYDTQIQSYVEMIISVLTNWYPTEYELLETLVNEGNAAFTEKIKLNTSIINHLTGYGIIKKCEDKYYITINAMEKYILSHSKTKMNPSTIEEKWSMISVRRNTLESHLRSIVLTIYKANFGKNTKEEVLKCFPTEQTNRLQELDLNVIIKDNLYFLDLKTLICKKWSFFEKMFIDKVKLELFIDYINKYRIDAHSKDIMEEQLGVLLIAFEWFDEKLRDFI